VAESSPSLPPQKRKLLFKVQFQIHDNRKADLFSQLTSGA
jgi:hypothetical protein